MSESRKQKRVLSKRDVPALKGHDNAMKRKQMQPVRDQKHDAEAIERAVYDGMQDLRVEKSK